MGFASGYLENRSIFPELIKEAPDRQTGIIVVVPAYNEPGIGRMLDSLALCNRPGCAVEVIVVVNAPEDASSESIENNKSTIINIESWKKENRSSFFRLYSLNVSPVVPGWGVGLARKTGMDEAVRRFDSINNPDGVILNLDADCTVRENYLTSVFSELLKRKERSGCSIYFEHPVSGTDFPESVFMSIIQYELHLRYYFQGLAYSGFPYVFHTVGSAIAVKALSYIKAGGMNRKQAGEDFYFIQKLVPSGGYFSLNSTAVYPSPRDSFRVPFGTGASIGKLSRLDTPVLYTYNLLAFKELNTYFSMVDKFFSALPGELNQYYSILPAGLRIFICEDEWIRNIREIKDNTSGLSSFKKRFFGWFNMFRIVKYLNFTHQEYFKKKSIETASRELLETKGIVSESYGLTDILLNYRQMEREY